MTSYAVRGVLSTHNVYDHLQLGDTLLSEFNIDGSVTKKPKEIAVTL